MTGDKLALGAVAALAALGLAKRRGSAQSDEGELIAIASLAMAGCAPSEYSLGHAFASDSGVKAYQDAVINFMCEETCEWADLDNCHQDLRSHWAYCIDERHEYLDERQADDCLEFMEATTDDCPLLPQECLVSRVVLPTRQDGEGCYREGGQNRRPSGVSGSAIAIAAMTVLSLASHFSGEGRL